MRHQELRRTKQVTFIYMKTDEEADWSLVDCVMIEGTKNKEYQYV